MIDASTRTTAARRALVCLDLTDLSEDCGETAVERGYAILNAEPPDPALPLPPGLMRVIRRCLEKAPEERFQLARDLAFALDAITDGSAVATPAPHPHRALGLRAWQTGR